MIDFDSYIGLTYDDRLKAKILLTSPCNTEIAVYPEGCIVTADYVPNRYRIFINNWEEKIITYISQG